MSYRGIRFDIGKGLFKNIIILVVSSIPVSFASSSVFRLDVPASTRSFRNGSSNLRNLRSNLGSNVRVSSKNSKLVSKMSYDLGKTEKFLSGLSLGVAGVSIVGTAVGLGITQEQFNQAKKLNEDAIERTYISFYDEREKEMKDLFDKWSVPLPDRYKNPMKNTEQVEPTPGFNIGTGD